MIVMSEEMEGYRQFIKNDVLDANPLHPPASNDSLDLSKVLDKPCNPYGVPDETIDDLQIFSKKSFAWIFRVSLPYSRFCRYNL